MKLSLPDGRILGYELYGPVNGYPVISMHGTPGSRLGRFPIGDPYTAAGVRVAVPERPGYGESTRLRGRTVAAAAGDAALLADELGWETFAVLGASGGGPHALAIAALMPQRVTRVVCRVGLAPPDAQGLDYFAGMAEGNIQRMQWARDGEEVLRPHLEAEVPHLLSRLAADPANALGAGYRMPESDREQMKLQSVHEMMVKNWQEAFKQGADGWIDDSIALSSPWGFAVSSVSVPVKVIHGAEDILVPASHGKWLAAHLPNAIEEAETGGHLGFTDPEAAARLLAWLATSLE